MAEKSSLTFSFEGGYEVDALAFAKTINSLVEMSTAIAEREYPDIKFGLTVKAIEKGSLKFDFVAMAMAMQPLLQPDSIAYASNMIQVIKAAFGVKKFLKGKNPRAKRRDGEEIIITNSSGAELRVPASCAVIFADQRVDNSVNNIIDCARSSPYVEGIRISANGDVDIPRGEFDDCVEPLDVDEIDSESITSTSHNVVLFIRQPDFTGDLKWKFKGDQNITASVSDSEFKRKVQSAEISLSAQTYIIADVVTKTPLSSNGIPDTAHQKHEIVKVHEVHTPGEGQMKLDI